MSGITFIKSHKKQLLTVMVLFIISLVSYGTLNSPIISSDDWSYFVAKYVFGELHPINLNDRRPFILVLYYVLSILFGIHFEYYYFVNFMILFLSAVLVYFNVLRLLPVQGWIASLIAFTYLVYPVDFSRTWVIMIYIRFWWLVSLGVIWLLQDYAETGNIWKFAIAYIGILFPLGAYEGQIGIVLLASVLIAYRIPRIHIRRKLAILGSILTIGFIFLIWRFIIQPKFFGVNDQYVNAFQLDPRIILDRYIQGLEIFVSGWIHPIQTQIQMSGINFFYWLSSYVIICCIVIFWLLAANSRPAKLPTLQKNSEIRSCLIAILVGGGLWIAGYIPVIGLYTPSLGGYASRVNLYAIAGASIALVSVVALLATFLSNSIKIKYVIIAAFFVPFILGGTFEQILINQERQIAWETQTTIWNGIFKSVPNVHDNKSVVIIIPGYETMRPFQFKPFLFDWEVQAGAQILYNNPTIGGYFYYCGAKNLELHFSEKGFKSYPTAKLVPYKRLIFLYFDPSTKTVELVNNLEMKLGLPFVPMNYYPNENIRSIQPSTTNYRWLVR